MWMLCVEFDKDSVDIILVLDILKFKIGVRVKVHGILTGKFAVGVQ